jgi:LuxR family quorum-sensing system transcriptional regulator CciR
MDLPRGKAYDTTSLGGVAIVQLSWPLLQSLVAEIGRVESLTELACLLGETVPRLGFDHYALVHHVDLAGPPRGAVHLDNYPVNWRREFIEARYYVDDPVHVACRRHARPFFWRDLPQLLPLNRRQVAMLADGRDAGLADGLTVPIHLPGDVPGSCTFAVRGREVAAALAPAAQFFGCHAFEAARRLADRRQRAAAEQVVLTARQLDCLHLVARGKTDSEIAALLGISRETAHEHVEVAKARLRVATRTQLVARALFHGLINYGDIL